MYISQRPVTRVIPSLKQNCRNRNRNRCRCRHRWRWAGVGAGAGPAAASARPNPYRLISPGISHPASPVLFTVLAVVPLEIAHHSADQPRAMDPFHERAHFARHLFGDVLRVAVVETNA